MTNQEVWVRMYCAHANVLSNYNFHECANHEHFSKEVAAAADAGLVRFLGRFKITADTSKIDAIANAMVEKGGAVTDWGGADWNGH